MVIFDCNGVLVDSERLATQVLSDEFARAGFSITPEVVARYFTGLQLVDVVQDVEAASGRPLPRNFAARTGDAVLQRLRADVRTTAHAAQALAWLRGPKCVASSSSLERIRATLESTGLIRFFDPHLFSASQVRRGKPAPDLFLHVAQRMGVEPRKCIVVAACA